MSGVNVEFYKAQVLKQLDVLDQRLITNGASRAHPPLHLSALSCPHCPPVLLSPASSRCSRSTRCAPIRLCEGDSGEDASATIVSRRSLTPVLLDAPRLSLRPPLIPLPSSPLVVFPSPFPSLPPLCSFLAIGVSTFAVLFLVWGVGAQFVTNLVGFAYPLYESFRSLNAAASSATTHSQQQWLTYWIIYAIFALVESLTDFFLYWIPFYHLVKIAFLVWCFLPSTRGAELIYVKVIEPVLVRYEGKIDSVGREGRRAASRVISDVAADVAQAAQEGEGTSTTS